MRMRGKLRKKEREKEPTMRKKKEKKESKSYMYRLKEFQCREPTARHIFPWSNFRLVVSVRGVS
jgi:hypothetical protein